ncbi:MAG TPA: 50S ribosomal protein L5 [Candidatus Paceibacterota bacterium]|jgi:large subunit ribosomal protein L5|nr:50S ribosomal protein L5 [Candidatus Paceibacterota bacterium]
MNITKEKELNTAKALKDFGYKNAVSAPHLTKISISVGTGSGMKKDREKNNLVADRLAKITGQKPSLRAAKKSVAGFKSREGDPVGLMVTLRGARMYHFMDKLINIALPRTKDFRGIDPKSVDAIGNMTIGIKEHTIFPETSDEDLRDVFGLAVTIGTTAKNKEEALAFFTHLGIPFKK